MPTLPTPRQVAQGGAHAVTVSVAVVGALIVVCLGMVWLLPKKAADDEHQLDGHAPTPVRITKQST